MFFFYASYAILNLPSQGKPDKLLLQQSIVNAKGPSMLGKLFETITNIPTQGLEDLDCRKHDIFLLRSVMSANIIMEYLDNEMSDNTLEERARRGIYIISEFLLGRVSDDIYALFAMILQKFPSYWEKQHWVRELGSMWQGTVMHIERDGTRAVEFTKLGKRFIFDLLSEIRNTAYTNLKLQSKLEDGHTMARIVVNRLVSSMNWVWVDLKRIFPSSMDGLQRYLAMAKVKGTLRIQSWDVNSLI